MNTFREVCDFIENYLPENPTIIETGCMYTLSEDNGVHNTTINLARVAAKLNGRLFSFDINQSHIDFAKSHVSKIKADIRFYLGDSVNRLLNPRFKGFSVNVVCLDSKEFDPDHMVNEYKAITPILAKDHYLLIDDIHNAMSVKWTKLYPIVKRYYKVIEIPTPTGLALCSANLPLPGVDAVSTD